MTSFFLLVTEIPQQVRKRLYPRHLKAAQNSQDSLRPHK